MPQNFRAEELSRLCPKQITFLKQKVYLSTLAYAMPYDTHKLYSWGSGMRVLGLQLEQFQNILGLGLRLGLEKYERSSRIYCTGAKVRVRG